jgi:hypothetical protein
MRVAKLLLFKSCQVPLLARNWLVEEPKVIVELIIFEALSSFITKRSPLAIAAVAVISPALVILP